MHICCLLRSSLGILYIKYIIIYGCVCVYVCVCVCVCVHTQILLSVSSLSPSFLLEVIFSSTRRDIYIYFATDFCQPNPCQNGGSCEPSVWPNEPRLVTCVCPPGYDGHLCQYQVLDACSLPLSTGVWLSFFV